MCDGAGDAGDACGVAPDFEVHGVEAVEPAEAWQVDEDAADRGDLAGGEVLRRFGAVGVPAGVEVDRGGAGVVAPRGRAGDLAVGPSPVIAADVDGLDFGVEAADELSENGGDVAGAHAADDVRDGGEAVVAAAGDDVPTVV